MADTKSKTSLDRRDLLLAVLLTSLLAIPFLNKPFHIDDPVVLAISENIVSNPLDPLAGEIDWFGSLEPTWKVTTNPPFLSYYLAPFLYWSGYSEALLHLAVSPFFLVTLLSSLWLSRRFTGESWLPALFLLTSPAIWVSMNLMRDVPALALASSCLALFMCGSERKSQAQLATGAVLGGLAILTKYSAAVVIPVLLAYLLLTKRYRQAGWLTIPAAFFLAWCLFTTSAYGIAHPYYLLTGDHPGSSISTADKSLAVLTIFASNLFLWPALIWAALRRRRLLVSGTALVLAAAAVLAARGYHGAEAGLQYFFWTAAGAIGLTVVLAQPLRLLPRLFSLLRTGGTLGGAGTSVFLLAWFLGPVLFSILFAPFQAVRHVLLALLPFILLAFRDLEGHVRGAEGAAPRRFLVFLLLVQAVTAQVVHLSDSEYAGTYRRFASMAKGEFGTDNRAIWFVGHWGWQIYARQAGFRQLHSDGAQPETGDILIWPERVHIGKPFPDPVFRDRLQEERFFIYEGRWPFRTMNFQGAAFYATIRRNLPYAIQNLPLETFHVYRVGPSNVER